MALILRTIIVPASIVEAARNLGECLHPAAAGMFTTPLSQTGLFPATHYVSSGLIEDIWLTALYDANVLYAAAQQGAKQQGLVLTASLVDTTLLIANTDNTNEPAFQAFARLGLQACAVEES